MQGVDLDNDLLIYACAGLAVTPEKAAAHQQAAAQLSLDAAQPVDPTQPIDAEAAAAVAAIPSVQADPAALDAAIDPAAQEAAAAVDVTGGHRHHHHHRRHLLQANVEWAAPYLVSQHTAVGAGVFCSTAHLHVHVSGHAARSTSPQCDAARSRPDLIRSGLRRS